MDQLSLEDHFKAVCSKHPHLKLLESQWRFDEELISKALQNVSSIFPHYSRHDASHSRQILVNIERMLGDKIKYLTATDTWLIMEAAYNHDIGMVITQKQLQDLDTPAFNLYIKDIIAQPENHLYKFAKKWEEERARLPKGADSHVFFNQYIQLIAEWYRKKHPENSAKIVDNPVGEIGLNSPRNELLPKRLFGVLSEVCRAHGENFTEVMKLPFSEAGMATEDCHPRYVACLLRMGDLLDLDDNRFCPVMLHMCGKQLPKLSKSHVDKHHSIKHFRLDAERIEAESECPSPAAYEVAFEWFKWLETEYHQQTQHWDKIVPSKELGNLPTLTTPTVTIKDPYLVLEQGKKPSFKVDQKAILDLVRSTGLYTSKFESIREILQNAVDATLIAIWAKYKSEIENLNPTAPRLLEIFGQYAINVDLEEEDTNDKIINLRVKDQGTGIDFETLKYMLEVGATYKNKSKRNIIDEMPIWYRPSGNFGIGLQSSYLISNRFTIKSKSRETHEALRVEFSQKVDKTVVIKKITPSSVDYGTTFEMKIKIKKFPNSMQLPSHLDTDYLSQKLNEYDFTKADSNLRCYETIKIYKSIAQFNLQSPIKINYFGTPPAETKKEFFCSKSNIVISGINFTNSKNPRLATFFRGQPFDGFNYYFYCLSAKIDFYGYSAKDFLTYNREKMLPQVSSKARTDVVTAVKSYIESEYENIPVLERPYAAAFYFMHVNSAIKSDMETQLLKFIVAFSDGTQKSLEQVTSEITSKQLEKITTPGYSIETIASPTTLAQHTSEPALDLIIYFANKNGFFHQLSYESNIAGGQTYTWSDKDIQPVSDEVLKNVLTQELTPHNGVGSRLLFPCWGKFRKLAIKGNIPWAKTLQYKSNHNEYLVLPCHFTNASKTPTFHDNTDIALWTYNNRKMENITLPEIKQLYDDMTQYLKQILEQ